MLDFIFKHLLLWKKKQQLHQLNYDYAFMSYFYENDLKKDEEKLLDQLMELKKDPATANSPEATRLQNEIVEIQDVKKRISNNRLIRKELSYYIEALKKQ